MVVDSKIRCFGSNSEIYAKYHDEEWAVPIYDDTVLFEFLVLEGAQAGLSWETVLKKRENYRRLFDNFDVKKISNYDSKKIDKILLDSGIIRNKLKVNSVVKNSKVFLDIQKEFGSFSDYLWGYVNHESIINSWKEFSDIPAYSELSDRISKDLKKRGMTFVGTTIIYAYLQAVGVVNDHFSGCHCYSKGR